MQHTLSLNDIHVLRLQNIADVTQTNRALIQQHIYTRISPFIPTCKYLQSTQNGDKVLKGGSTSKYEHSKLLFPKQSLPVPC